MSTRSARDRVTRGRLLRLLEPVLAADVKKGLRVELEKIKSAVGGNQQDAPSPAPTT